MSVKWNEYTWYSKLAAMIFFIGILPILAFYIGRQYESVVTMHTQEKINYMPGNVSSKSSSSVYLSDDGNGIINIAKFDNHILFVGQEAFPDSNPENPDGGESINTGAISGEAPMVGNAFLYTDSDYEYPPVIHKKINPEICKIKFTFTSSSTITVDQMADSATCGLGNNVTFSGNYSLEKSYKNN